MYETLLENTRQEVGEYLAKHPSQAAIQEARTELRYYRLGRQPHTDWERQQVVTIKAADKLLRLALSDTLSKNRKLQSNWQRG